MADIKPFKGIRPKPEYAQRVAALPYDVVNVKEAKDLVKDNVYSFLKIEKGEVNFEAEMDTHRVEVHKKSAEILQQFLNESILMQDSKPCFYLYELTMGKHRQRGIVCGASVSEYENSLIKKHEFTRKDKEDERTIHVDTLNANTGPVLLAYPADKTIQAQIDKFCSTAKPVYDFSGANDTTHRVWVMDDGADVAAMQNNFKKVPAMYIADGHHRSAAAFRVRDIKRKNNPNHTGSEEYNYFLSVAFPDTQLQIMGYHRVVKDLNNLTTEEFLKKVSEKFDLSETANPQPQKPCHFTMYLEGKWYSMKAKKGTYPQSDPILSLDVSILQKNLLEPILNIYDIRTNKRIDFVGGIRGTNELEKRCREDMRVAFALYPTGIRQLMAVSDQNEVMPPKSTWFEPKLLSGVVTHSLV
ncbi:MAG: DUF1015 domain-containing protein [Chitinivibrionales bacterium]|nr:DUF1015 domain-containing protein [Chitinivibrionales bacterium]